MKSALSILALKLLIIAGYLSSIYLGGSLFVISNVVYVLWFPIALLATAVLMGVYIRYGKSASKNENESYEKVITDVKPYIYKLSVVSFGIDLSLLVLLISYGFIWSVAIVFMNVAFSITNTCIVIALKKKMKRMKFNKNTDYLVFDKNLR